MTTLPHSLDAEKSILGTILIQPTALHRVADVVPPEDFYHPTNAVIYRAMLELDAAGSPLDQVTISEHMKAQGTDFKLRAHGGIAYFGTLMEECATLENVAFHARIVAAKAAQRRAIEVAQEVQAIALAGDDGWQDVAGAKLFDCLTSRTTSTLQSAKAVVRRVSDAIGARYDRKEAITGIPTGWEKLDEILAGLQPALYVVAGRPGMGKSALLVGMALHAAVECRVPSLLFELEMSADSNVERMIAADGRINGNALRTGLELSQSDWLNLAKAGGRIGNAPLWFDDSGSPSLLEVRVRARRWRSETRTLHPRGWGLIGIDYLGLMATVEAKGKAREREVAELTRGLKALSKELDCPVVVLSQLNRGVESRSEKRPTLGDLRESGAIEQDADVVLFLYRDAMYDPQSPAGNVAEVIVAKQRNGRMGTAHLAFSAPHTRFDSSNYVPEQPKPRSNGRYNKSNGYHPYAPEEDDR